MMGGMIGGAESLITGAAGLMAVNEAIKQTPDLAYAANGAMQKFDKGIRQAASSAIAEGVPALHQLGSVLHGLGTEVGGIGAEHMPTALSAVSDLAGNATQALKGLDPAIESSIKGLTGLGDAVMQGISSPGAVMAIKGVGDALSDPKNDAGIASLVSGLSAVSGVAATVVANVAGLTGGDTGRTSNDVTGGLTGGLLGKSVLGGKSGFAGGAGILGLATDEQQRGQDPTGGVLGGFGGMLASKALGIGGLPALALTAGSDLLGHQVQATQGGAFTHAADDQSGVPDSPLHGPTGSGSWRDSTWLGKAFGTVADAIGGPPKSPTSPAGASSSPFPQGVSAPHGWDSDGKGNLTPAKAPTSFDRELATQKSSRDAAQQLLNSPHGAASVTQPGGVRQGGLGMLGFGSGMQPIPQNAAQQLQQANTGMQSLAQTTSSVAPPMQQLGQLSSTSGVQMAQMAQHTQAQAAAVQTLNQVTRPTMSSLNQLPQQAQQSMAQAQSSLVSGGNQMGAVMPQSMAGGISSGQSQVCNASQQLSQGAADCASSALGIQSPSRVFMGIGAQTGAGMALGIAGSSGVAAGAAGTAMLDVASVASNYAKDAGLALGHVMGTNLASGLNTSITQSALKATGLAQGVDSPLAKMVLGQLGLLGKAGGGAQSWDLLNNAGVASFGSGSPAQPATIPTPQVIVHIGNEALDSRMMQVSTRNFEELGAALAGARR